MGEIGILNVGAGDTKLVFDPNDPEETKRAGKIVQDMIRRGYALLIEVGHNEKGPIYQRAKDFDPVTSEYIIIDTAPEGAQEEKADGRRASQSRATPPAGRGKAPKAPRGKTTRIPASGARGVAVARTAGG